MKQLKIKISPDGKIEAETFGMKGKTCLKYIAEVEKMANAVCDDSEFTSEYYETDNQIVADNDLEVKANG